MTHILMSIRQEWMAKILNGEKTVEIRKTIPKELKNGHPCTFWGYCTKARSAKEWLVRCLDDVWRTIGTADGWVFSPGTIHFDGLVVCKFMVEKVRRVVGYDYETDEYSKPFFEIHITALEIIEPLPLGAFQSEQITGRYETGVKVRKWLPITKAPQSWMYVLPPKEGEGK